MPRLVNARTTVCATCWSTPASICGSASRIVTSAAHVDEERRELAADRTAADHRDPRGHVIELEHVVGREDARRRRTRSRARERAAQEPVAMHTLAPAHLGAVGDARRGGSGRRAGCRCPATIVTLRPFSSVSSPPTSRSTTCCLRTWLAARSTSAAPAVHAELGRAPHGAQHLAVSSSSFAGMQPQLRHVPPTRLLLDDRDVHAGRRAVERGGVSAGTAAEHHEIEFRRIDFFGHGADPFPRRLKSFRSGPSAPRTPRGSPDR